MKTAVMTDTNSALTVASGKEAGIFVLPMPIIIDNNSYNEGIDLSYEELWKAFEEDKDISTSMPSLGDILDMWTHILEEEGYDELVYIPMSSGLSGSCAAATAAALEFDGKVQVVDNHRISVSQMNAAYDAKDMADKGMTALQIKEELEKSAYDSSIYVSVNSLRYLVKSGRVTDTAAKIANVLHLKPVLQIQGGKLDAYAKARGMNNAFSKMIDGVKKDLETRFADVPKENLSLCTAGTFRNPADEETWRKMVEDKFPGMKVVYRPLSCSIACHVGIDAAGIGITKISYDQDKYY